MSNQPQLYWYNPDWQKRAHEWIRKQAEGNSIHITGEIEQNHAYAWSTVMRVPTSDGTLFFKATAGETLFEIALTQKLADWFPDCMPELVATDIENGWMLMRDGGEQLRASIRPTKDIKPWEAVIGRYSEVQIGLVDHVKQILSLGIPDHRLAILPSLYAELLKDEASLMIDQEKGLTSSEFKEVKEKLPRFQELCTKLAAFGIPETLNNGDFHDGNILLKDGRITFFDWGDATVTHPFVSLRTFFVSIEISLDLEENAFTPEMAALLDHYLEPWQKFASKDDLLTAYQLSKPVAAIVKTLLWHATISQLDGALRNEYAWIVPELWREFLMYEKNLSKI
jgi:aminoglycoside/choline kinase family phosphotransferase